MSPISLTFCSDWKVCSACGLPPRNNSKLLVCRNCKSAAYHNAQCQKIHWKGGHKHDCKILQAALRPLLDLAAVVNNSTAKGCCRWWKAVARKERNGRTSDPLWQSGLADWSRKDYLQAMQGFQSSLNPCQKSWELFLSEQEQQAHQQSLNNSNNVDDITTDNSRRSSSR